MISFVLNFPYTLVGVVLALFLRPKSWSWGKKPFYIVVEVSSDSFGFGYLRGWRGMTVGHTIILNPRVEEKDFEHELIHVKQYDRLPLVFPFLYYLELIRHGYRQNKYEEEAYTGAGNVYRSGQLPN